MRLLKSLQEAHNRLYPRCAGEEIQLIKIFFCLILCLVSSNKPDKYGFITLGLCNDKLSHVQIKYG